MTVSPLVLELVRLLRSPDSVGADSPVPIEAAMLLSATLKELASNDPAVIVDAIRINM